jgi:hypothetical protein
LVRESNLILLLMGLCFSMIKRKNKTSVYIDRWFFVISGALVIILLIVAVTAIIFLSGQIFQSLAPIDKNDSEVKYNLEGYKNLNLPAENGT